MQDTDTVDHGVLDEYLRGDKALAQELGKAPRTIARWRSQGGGPAITRIGKSIYYHRDDVKAWLEAQRIDPA